MRKALKKRDDAVFCRLHPQPLALSGQLAAAPNDTKGALHAERRPHAALPCHGVHHDDPAPAARPHRPGDPGQQLEEGREASAAVPAGAGNPL